MLNFGRKINPGMRMGEKNEEVKPKAQVPPIGASKAHNIPKFGLNLENLKNNK